MADNVKPEETSSAKTTDYIEYLGDAQDPNSHGVTFLTSHTIPKGDGLWKRLNVESPKEIVWERDPLGPPVGQKGARMLARVEDMTPQQATALEKVPGYRRVSE